MVSHCKVFASPRAGAVIGGRGLMGSTSNECCEKKSCHDWKCTLASMAATAFSRA